MNDCEEEMKDINWSVDFEITVNGKTCNFWDLSEAILDCIRNDSYSGTFTD